MFTFFLKLIVFPKNVQYNSFYSVLKSKKAKKADGFFYKKG